MTAKEETREEAETSTADHGTLNNYLIRNRSVCVVIT